MSKKIEIAKLKAHRLNQKIYGNEEISQDFLDSLNEFGILVPLKVKSDNTIISGHRRWKGAKRLGLDKVPVETITFSSKLAEREAILTYNKQRDKTYSQKMKEGEEWEDIEEEKAEKRMKKGKKLDPTENFPEGSKGESRDKIAEKIKIGSGRTYDKAKKVWDKAKEGDKEAQKQVEKLDKEEQSIHGAKKALQEEKEKPHVTQNSGNNEWYTPKKYIEQARKVMGSIDLDPASSKIANETVKADKFFSENDNGLEKEWHGNIWLNPPYSYPEVSDFSDKLIEQWKLGNIRQACLLVNNSTETDWFQEVVSAATSICFIDTRIVFRKSNGKPGNSPLQGQCLIYFGNNVNTLKKKCNGVTYERKN